MNNIDRIRQRLPEFKIDAMIVTSPINRQFATGFASSAGTLLVTNADAWLVVDSRYAEAAVACVRNATVIPLDFNERFEERIEKLLVSSDVHLLGFEDEKITVAKFNKMRRRHTKLGVKMIPAQKLINELRNIKSYDELDKMIAAQRLAERVFSEVLPLISASMTEKDLAAELIYRALKHGAEKESFDPIVLSGANTSRPHGVPGLDKIGKGFLTIDFGVILDGWCSDTTRTYCVGDPDEEMVRVYTTVLRAQEAGIAAVRGGVRGCAADAAARDVIEQAGYGEYFGHALSHSLGMEVHEFLSASPLSKNTLPAGAVISVEPGIYIPGRFGVRIEDVVYITEEGCENFTALPKELMVL